MLKNNSFIFKFNCHFWLQWASKYSSKVPFIYVRIRVRDLSNEKSSLSRVTAWFRSSRKHLPEPTSTETKSATSHGHAPIRTKIIWHTGVNKTNYSDVLNYWHLDCTVCLAGLLWGELISEWASGVKWVSEWSEWVEWVEWVSEWVSEFV